MSVLTAAIRNRLPDSAFALPGRRYPIHDKRHAVAALVYVAKNGTPDEQARVRAAVARRYPALPSSRDHAADGSADIELGSYGSKWRHGWIPLNPVATAIKLKQFRAGGSFHSEKIGAHTIHVAPNHRGKHSAMIEHPNGSAHYVEHDTSHGALAMARRHESVAPKARVQVRATTHRGEAGHAVVGKDAAGRKVKVFAPGERANAEAAAKRIKEGKPAFAPKSSKYEELRRAGRAKTTSEGVDKVTTKTSRQEQMLPGVREHQGVKYVVKDKGSSPMAPRDAYPVETMGGAHVGHFRVVNGKLHIGASKNSFSDHSLEEHQIGNVKQGIAWLHASHQLYLRNVEAKKAKAEADAKAAKTPSDYTSRQKELSALADKVLDRRGVGHNYSDRHGIREQMVREAQLNGKTHEEAVASLKRQHAEEIVKNRKSNERTFGSYGAQSTLFGPPPKPRKTTKDTEKMAAARAELSRRTGDEPLNLNSEGEHVNLNEKIKEGTTVEHGGRAGHVIGVYGSTFDTYHPPTEGTNGFYMRHEIRTRRGRKHLVSTFGGHSAATADTGKFQITENGPFQRPEDMSPTDLADHKDALASIDFAKQKLIGARAALNEQLARTKRVYGDSYPASSHHAIEELRKEVRRIEASLDDYRKRGYRV